MLITLEGQERVWEIQHTSHPRFSPVETVCCCWTGKHIQTAKGKGQGPFFIPPACTWRSQGTGDSQMASVLLKQCWGHRTKLSCSGWLAWCCSWPWVGNLQGTAEPCSHLIMLTMKRPGVRDVFQAGYGGNWWPSCNMGQRNPDSGICVWDVSTGQ